MSGGEAEIRPGVQGMLGPAVLENSEPREGLAWGLPGSARQQAGIWGREDGRGHRER